jgi:hypothetical protein
MKPTDNFSQFPENGMSTPEIGALGREVLRITNDGHIICGEGLSVNAATQEAAKLLIASFEEQIQKMVDARIAADREKVRVLREALDFMLNGNSAIDQWPMILQARAALAATKEAGK